MVRRALNTLSPAPWNPREISDAAMGALTESMSRFGLVQPIILNERTGHVVGGHQRLKVLEGRGVAETDVVLIDVSKSEERALGVALNNPHAQGDFTEALGELLAGIRLDDAELFEGLGLGALVEDGEKEGLTDPDAVPEPPDAAVTERGDLWLLGDHRLLCGDSGNHGDVDRLLDGATVHLVNTDPPYNVKVAPRSGNAASAAAAAGKFTGSQGMDAAIQGRRRATDKKLRPKDRPLEGDFVSDEEFLRLLRGWFGNIERVLAPGRSFYIWGGYGTILPYRAVLLECSKLFFSQTLVWVKEHPVLTRKDFLGNHEWCFYGWRQGAGHYFNPEITNATDVWSVKKISPQAMVHLTEKPAELAVRAMTYSSRPGENVLDLFGGSGSTLIGAEKTGRRAFLMEIDPLYSDVIVQRWEEFTGHKAKRKAKG